MSVPRCCLLGILLLGPPCVVQAANLLPNSSFEVGIQPDGTWADMRWNGGYVGTVDVAGQPPPPHGRVAAGVDHSIFSTAAFHVPHPGRPHVLSFSIRADQSRAIVVQLRPNPPDSQAQNTNLSQAVQAGEEWRRVELPCVPEGGLRDLYTLRFETPGGVFWVDAVQLEEGDKASAYLPDRPVEYALVTARHHNVFSSPGDFAITVQAFNHTAQKLSAATQLVVRDFRNRNLLARPVALRLPPGLTSQPVKLPLKALGAVRVELWQADGPLLAEVVAGVLPPVAEADRGGGSQQPESDPVWVRHLGLKYVGGEVAWWDWVQPEGPDAWDWKRADDIVAKALAQGLVFKGTWLIGVPKWATDKPDKQQPWPPGDQPYFDMPDWLRYVAAVVTRYKGKVGSWSVWNEPFFADAGTYLELLKATREAMKQADPAVEVCGTDIPPLYASWMDAFIRQGGLSQLDAMTAHAYGQGGGYLPEPLSVLPRWARYDGVKRPLYNQETHLDEEHHYTFYTGVQPANTGSWRNPGGMVPGGHPSEEAAARWAKLVITNHAMGVDVVMPHYFFVARWPSTQSRGCPEADGAVTPAACAWAMANRTISTAEAQGQVPGSPDLRLMLFSKRDTPIAVVWTREHEGGQYRSALADGLFRTPEEAARSRDVVRKIVLAETHTLALKLRPGQFRALDLMGNPVAVTAAGEQAMLPVSRDPTYLIGQGVSLQALRAALAKAEVSGLGAVDIATAFATSRAGKAAIVATLTSRRGSSQTVKVRLAEAPPGMTFATRSQEVTVPARRSAQVAFEPTAFAPLPRGEAGFGVEVAADEKLAAGQKRLWLARCERFATAPALDGNLDEWRGHTVIALDRKDQLEAGATFWKSASDLSAQVRTGWDEANLYLSWEITDAGGQVFPSAAGGGLYSYDAVEMFLDLDIVGDLRSRDLGDDDRQIMVSPDGSRSDGGVLHWSSGPLEGLRGAWVRTTGGYNLEVALPWANFAAYGALPRAGTVIGLQVTACDNDGPSQGWKKLAWTGFPEAYHDTSLWGRLALVD